MTLMDDRSRLRRVMKDTAEITGRPMKDLTVLSVQRDPFRIDTPASHRDAEWLAMQLEELGLSNQQIHLRGVHYALLGRIKPNGEPYVNDEDNWKWVSEDAAKAARFLGYIPFDRITDRRNAAPVIAEQPEGDPWSDVDDGLWLDLPRLTEGLAPTVSVENFVGRQPYRIVLYGEKSSLEPVLAPIARSHLADLYLPTGEISDTQLHRIAANGAQDGRPMVVLTFSDADPSGWQMPISIGHKLRALQEGLFPELIYEVRRVALKPTQVIEYGLPSTPLKATERRGDKWRATTGTEQTEVDALASLRPDLLREIATTAIEPYFDRDLDRRTTEARADWERQAQAVVDEALAGVDLGDVEVALRARIEEVRLAVSDARRTIEEALDDIVLPDLRLPTSFAPGASGQPLTASWWPFSAHCEGLISSKEYRRSDEGFMCPEVDQ